MAKVKPIKDSGGLLAEVDPAADTLDAKINISGPSLLGRKTTGEGGHEELTPSAMTEHTTPAAGDMLVGFEAGSDVPKKIDIGNLPAAGGDSLGTGFTSGGGSGTIPDGTTAAAGENFAQITWSNLFPSGIYFNKYKYSDGTLNPYGNGAMYIGSAGAGCGIQFAPDEGRLSAIGDDGDYRNEVMYLSASGIMFKGFSVGSGLAVGFFEINENNGLMLTDSRATPLGLTYAGDYSETVAVNGRSIPDVGTTKKITQRLAFLASC